MAFLSLFQAHQLHFYLLYVGFHEHRGDRQNTFTWLELDFPGGSDSKESVYNSGDPGLIPELGRSPREGIGYPLLYSCLQKSVDRGAQWATVPRVVKNQTGLSEWHFHFSEWMPSKQIRRDVSHYTLTHTHTHFSVSPACRILVQKQDITKYIFQWFLNLWPKSLGPRPYSLEGKTGTRPSELSSMPLCFITLASCRLVFKDWWFHITHSSFIVRLF